MKTFEDYLQNQGYKPRSILNHVNTHKLFRKWLKQEDLNGHDIKPFHILSYIDFCRSKGNSNDTIQIKLQTLNHYYTFLFQNNFIQENPASHIKLKKNPRSILSFLLEEKQLDKLYHEYDGKLRNKVALSLMIYQGVSVRDFDFLTVENINLNTAKIELQGHSKANNRTLYLKAFQIILLHDYLTNERPKLLEKRAKSYKGEDTDKLIPSSRKGQRFKDIGDHFILELKAQFLFFKSFGQIRNSVIANWLKHYNLREVQVMAGHKYVSSTEKFQISQIDDLSEKVEKYHPLG